MRIMTIFDVRLENCVHVDMVSIAGRTNTLKPHAPRYR